MDGFTVERVAPGRLKVTGVLGFETAAQALSACVAQLGRENEQVMDLSAVTHGDSAGLAVLIECIAAGATAGARVRYENVPSQMLAIARISDLEDLLVRA